MSKKPISLTVHKNAVERRRKRDMSRELCREAGKMVRERDIRAYAIVGIGANGKAYACWDSGSIMPLWAFAETMGSVLRDDIAVSGVKDDWKPPLVVPKGQSE